MRKTGRWPGRSSQLSSGVPGRLQGGSTPAGAPPALTKEHEMTPDTTSTTLTRAERLLLAAAAMRGVLAGAAREITTWLLEHYIH